MRTTVLRIGIWVLGGALVVGFWTILMMTNPGHQFGRWAVFSVTVPVSLLGRARPMTYQSVMLLNAAAYGLIGLAVEPILRRRPLSC